MLNFVLCDDNPSILNKLSKMLEAIFIENNIDACIKLESSSAEEVIDYVSKNNIDAIILDINLNSKITGCDIADLLRKEDKKVYIIFTTGHLEYALIAYKYKTFDYLPKPITKERLKETILRLVDDMQNVPSKFIKINSKTIINENEINYIKKDGMKIVFCANNRKYETYSSFNKLNSCLPDNFIRCHKSYVANINNISDINSNKNIVLFSNNDQCSIGDKYKNNFLEGLNDEFFTNNLDGTNNTK